MVKTLDQIKTSLKGLFSKGKELKAVNFEQLIDDSVKFEESELSGGGLKLEDSRIHIAVSTKWMQNEGHLSDAIRLQWTAERAKPALSWCDEKGDDKFAIIAHYKANDAGQPDHVHGSIETTKTDGSLHTRMEFPFDNDICEIQTWDSNFTINGLAKVAGSKSSNREIVLATANKKADSLDENGRIIPDQLYAKRWSMRANSTPETGSNQGSDFEIARYKDDGSVIGTTVFIKRSNGYVGIGTKTPTRPFDLVGDAIRIRSKKTPASSTAVGEPGSICWDDSYMYVCIADNTWKRTAIETW